MPHLSLHTPVGDISVAEENGCLVAADWGWARDQIETSLLRSVRDMLHAYFDGAPVSFADLPFGPKGSEYRLRVWRALQTIPFGETRTYADIARAAGGSPRSVGTANRLNPIPILIPCHRVVAGGGIGGYSGGEGVATKRFLLQLEGRARPLLAYPE